MITNVLKSILENCVQMNVQIIVDDMNKSSSIEKSVIHRVYSSIFNGLSYQYHASWVYVLQILSSLYSCVNDKTVFPVIKEVSF
jgi:hypothetical protein